MKSVSEEIMFQGNAKHE